MDSRKKDFAARTCHALKLDLLPPTMRRIIVAVAGGTILLIGVIMVVLPGPAVLVVPIGLAILATEFVWAKRYVRKGKVILRSAKNSLFGKSAS